MAGHDPSPINLVHTVINHAVKVTANARTFMEENPGKRQPSNYKLYPGKMVNYHWRCL